MERGEVVVREREGVEREGRRERKRCLCHMYVPKSGDCFVRIGHERSTTLKLLKT